MSRRETTEVASMLNSTRYVIRAIVSLGVYAFIGGLVMEVFFPPHSRKLVFCGIDVRGISGSGFRWSSRCGLVPAGFAARDERQTSGERSQNACSGKPWRTIVWLLGGIDMDGGRGSLPQSRTQCEFSFAFATVLGGFLACGGLGLWWLTLWARQKDGRLGQFGIGSLLFLMVFAATFLGRRPMDRGPDFAAVTAIRQRRAVLRSRPRLSRRRSHFRSLGPSDERGPALGCRLVRRGSPPDRAGKKRMIAGIHRWAATDIVLK